MKLEHPEAFKLEVAEKTLEWVTLHPELHHQEWEMAEDVALCAQTGCLMGWAALFAGNRRSGGANSGDLNLTFSEWHNIYAEMNTAKAIDILKDYITQAKIAQHTQDDYVLDNSYADEPVLELVLA